MSLRTFVVSFVSDIDGFKWKVEVQAIGQLTAIWAADEYAERLTATGENWSVDSVELREVSGVFPVPGQPAPVSANRD